MKIETRGKYPGCKLHLEPEECQILMDNLEANGGISMNQGDELARKMGNKIKQLLAQEPGLLQERTPEAIAAILAKESEKAALQLEALKTGQDWKKIDPDKLQEALNKHVKK